MPSGVVGDTYYYEHPAMPLASGEYGSGVILPSAEAHFFDFRQAHVYNNGSGINSIFPSVSSFGEAASGLAASGLIQTYAESPSGASHSGFYYDGLSGPFSNYGTVPATTDFGIFNSYIHNSGIAGGPLLIPYISDYIIHPAYDPYSILRYT